MANITQCDIDAAADYEGSPHTLEERFALHREHAERRTRRSYADTNNRLADWENWARAKAGAGTAVAAGPVRAVIDRETSAADSTIIRLRGELADARSHLEGETGACDRLAAWVTWAEKYARASINNVGEDCLRDCIAKCVDDRDSWKDRTKELAQIIADTAATFSKSRHAKGVTLPDLAAAALSSISELESQLKCVIGQRDFATDTCAKHVKRIDELSAAKPAVTVSDRADIEIARRRVYPGISKECLLLSLTRLVRIFDRLHPVPASDAELVASLDTGAIEVDAFVAAIRARCTK